MLDFDQGRSARERPSGHQMSFLGMAQSCQSEMSVSEISTNEITGEALTGADWKLETSVQVASRLDKSCIEWLLSSR